MSSPEPIETERLRLRAITMDDLGEMVRLHGDPLVAQFMGSPDRAWLERWVRSSWEDCSATRSRSTRSAAASDIEPAICHL